MHRKVDAAGEQGFLDFLGKESLAANIEQRPVLNGVARGADGPDGDPLGCDLMRPRQPVAHLMGLRQRQRAAPGADRCQNVCPAEDCTPRPHNATP